MEKFNDPNSDQPLFVFAPTKKQLITAGAVTLTVLTLGAAAVYVKKNPQILENVDESVHVETDA